MSREHSLKSMTAYGRGVGVCEYGRFTIELQSVNRRYLEVNVSLPRPMLRFEMDVRKKVSTQVGRGAVQVLVGWRPEGNQALAVVPNLSLARGVKRAWETIIVDLGLEIAVPLSVIAQEKDVLLQGEVSGDEEIYRKALAQALDEALSNFSEMKVKEGTALVFDLLRRAENCTKLIAAIEEHAPEASEKFRQRLEERLETLFSGSTENEEKILREVAVYAEKADVTEEIVRFTSHLQQFQEKLGKKLQSATETVGKGLDFLLQEMNREANTMGAKAAQIAASKSVVALKGELEKMREQVQNIE